MKLKICGMKWNTEEVAALNPDYLGFIFWKPSERYFEGEISKLPEGIQKVGVFVDASTKEILEKIEKHDLQAVQLHGKESPEFCRVLRGKLKAYGYSNDPLSSKVKPMSPSKSSKNKTIQIINVFSIKNNFDFSILEPYEEVCDYFLFDTKGELPGGNGYAFDWSILKDYPSTKPYFLSGGIGPEDVKSINNFLLRPESKYCHAIDVNSRFEIRPGMKNVDDLQEFIGVGLLDHQNKS